MPAHTAAVAHDAPPARRSLGGVITWVTSGWGVAAVTALALVPFAALVVEVLRANEFAVHSDAAAIELRVRDIGGPHTPLVGSYQRFGWNMPGPLFLYLLAVPYRLLGSNFSGLQVGTLLIHVAAFAGVVALVHRRFGAVPALLAVAILSVLGRALAPVGLTDAWEPRAVVFVFVLLIVATASMAAGATRVMPLVAFVATFLAQVYATVAPAAVALVLFGVAVLAVRHVRSRPPGHRVDEPLRRPVAISAGLLALLWLPPVLHELGSRPSNVGRIWSFARQGGETLGLADGVSAAALQLGRVAPWMTGDVTVDAWSAEVDLTKAPTIPVALLLLVAGIGVAWWRGRRDAALLGGAVLAALAAAVLALSRISELLYNWILEWTWGIGAACWLGAAICIWHALPRPWRTLVEVPLASALVVVVAVLAGLGVNDAVHLERPALWAEDAAVDVAPLAVGAARDLDGPVLVRSSLTAGGLFPGDEPGVEHLVLALERAGIEARVSDALDHKVGPHRLVEPGAVAGELRLAGGDGEDAPPGFEVLTTRDTLTPAESEELAEIEADLLAQGREDVTAEEIATGDQYAILRLVVGRRDELRDRPLVSLLFRPGAPVDPLEPAHPSS